MYTDPVLLTIVRRMNVNANVEKGESRRWNRGVSQVVNDVCLV